MWVRRILIRSYSSQFKPANKIRVKADALQIALANSTNGSIEWESVRKELIASERFINPANLDGIIIEKCNKDVRLDIAKSYFDFMNSKSLQMNDASIGKLLRLFYRHHQKTNQENSISEKDEAEIISLSNSLLEKHQILDGTLAENVIHGLVLTHNWMKCLDLLTHIQLTSTPSTSAYCCIISKALDEDNLDIAWKLLDQLLSNQHVPTVSVFLKYFNKFRHDDEATEKMLNLISENNLMLPEKSIEEFQKLFAENRECKIVKIGRRGKCLSCSNQLTAVQLNEAEFAKLSSTFLDNVMIRKDVFLKTNPEEVNRFKKFVDKTMPFDCVIDGLNVAYSHGTQQSPQMLVKNVASVVKYFADRNQNCLVIGRKHMNKWPKEKMEYIKRNSSLFLADNISQDDPFLLYAALKNGSNTKIFSRDLMRGHSVLLDLESKKLFRRWQQINQYSLVTTLQEEGIVVQEPIEFELRAHKIDSFWHVPFTSENLQFIHESFEIPSSWLCLKVGS